MGGGPHGEPFGGAGVVDVAFAQCQCFADAVAGAEQHFDHVADLAVGSRPEDGRSGALGCGGVTHFLDLVVGQRDGLAEYNALRYTTSTCAASRLMRSLGM